ncbi:hypothetical protein HMPREF1982_00515 [Clostridiales bacterium oral taxon 876 str. F0540]|nr:hypothetical protein HMPREF1982_00515 [Clostridiales bacterium oral taxon 876 str. F0540]
MISYKNTKWADQIIKLQKEDGSWGYFHTLSNPASYKSLTTEQALRRLNILGFTIEDEPIQRAVNYMHNCLKGKSEIPDRKEKVIDFDIFSHMMLAVWIRRFTYKDRLANIIAKQWSRIISEAFKDGEYNHLIYLKTYEDIFQRTVKGERLIDFTSFYQISLLSQELNKEIEPLVIKYILNKENGIYYIFPRKLNILPKEFQSKEASLYLGAIELLSEYTNPRSREQLMFVKNWLQENRQKEGSWDMGAESKNNIYLPLSDSWCKIEMRREDCTYRVNSLLKKLEC